MYSDPENESTPSTIRDRLLTYTEFAVIGGLIFGSLVNWSVPAMPMTPGVPIFTENSELLSLIKLEVFALIILFAAFGARGRGMGEIHWHISPKLLGVTYLLFASDYLLSHIIWSLSLLWFPAWETYDPIYLKSATLSMPLLFVFSCINGFFEEVVVVGYLSACLGKYHSALICGVISVLLRLSYHTYQGPVALISMIPMGIGFYYVYWRYKSIWPLVFAHAVMNYAYTALQANAP